MSLFQVSRMNCNVQSIRVFFFAPPRFCSEKHAFTKKKLRAKNEYEKFTKNN